MNEINITGDVHVIYVSYEAIASNEQWFDK